MGARPRTGRSLLGLVAAVVAAGVGCADPEQISYENSLQREIDRFEFRRPLEEVWPEVVGLLAEDGFVVRETSPVEGRTVVSELRPDHAGLERGYRALVRVNRTSRDRYKVRIQLQYESREGDEVRRSIEPWNVAGRPAQRLTWTLMERAEPARTAKILEKRR
jgi:hypothetical protein